MIVPLRRKYVTARVFKRNPAQGRTGPHCCCDHKHGKCCASGKKKGRK